MKVKDLISWLQNYHGDMEITVRTYIHEDVYYAPDISLVERRVFDSRFRHGYKEEMVIPDRSIETEIVLVIE